LKKGTVKEYTLSKEPPKYDSTLVLYLKKENKNI